MEKYITAYLINNEYAQLNKIPNCITSYEFFIDKFGQSIRKGIRNIDAIIFAKYVDGVYYDVITDYPIYFNNELYYGLHCSSYTEVTEDMVNDQLGLMTDADKSVYKKYLAKLLTNDYEKVKNKKKKEIK